MGNQDYVLSLDIGTTTIKSFVYDQLGQIQGHSSQKVRLHLKLIFIFIGDDVFRLSCCSLNQDGLRLIQSNYGAVLSLSSKKPLQV